MDFTLLYIAIALIGMSGILAAAHYRGLNKRLEAIVKQANADMTRLEKDIEDMGALVIKLAQRLDELEHDYSEEIEQSLQANRKMSEGITNLMGYAYTFAPPAEKRAE
jgi:hypothetical protein